MMYECIKKNNMTIEREFFGAKFRHERRGSISRERASGDERTPAATATECTATTSATLGQWSGRQNAPPPPQPGTGTWSHRMLYADLTHLGTHNILKLQVS